MYDIIIKNGIIIDGTGNPWFKADLGIKDTTISSIGKLKTKNTKTVIDAKEQVVSPGFIDIHTHSDFPLLVEGEGHSHIRQGVTTNVIGNCGTSAAPLSSKSQEQLKTRFAKQHPGFNVDWSSLGQYLAKLEKQGISLNVAALVGQGTIRNVVMEYSDRPPTAKEIDEMQELVKQSMEQGAFGLSSGLIYVPGCYASTEELIDLAKVAAKYNGSYNTHIRGENDTLLDAIKEALKIGRKANIPVQISHFKAMGRHMWGKSVETLKMLEEARKLGLDVACDQYPYNASATGLSASLPPWSHEGGTESFISRLKNLDTRARIKHDILNGLPDWISLHKGVGWENTIITSCRKHELEGKSIAMIAKMRGIDGFDAAFDILLECEGQVQVVYFTIGDEDLERILKHPLTMIGSDSSATNVTGPLAKGRPHPRAFGTFVRVLSRYVREKETITLLDAIRKMTSLPAQRMRLYDRGLLLPGMKADIVIFDPDTVNENSTYTEPFAYPDGINHVLVNGKITISYGEHLGIKAGKVLRLNRKA